MNPITTILTTLLRQALNGIAGSLLVVGVSHAQAAGLADAALPVVSSIVLFAAAHGWSYLTQRSLYQTPPTRS